MSKCWQLGALMKKNLILMKRNCCSTICEVFFPIILMILLVLVRRAIKINEFAEPVLDANFIQSNSSALVSPEVIMKIKQNASLSNPLYALRIRNPFAICASRPVIASIGTDPGVTDITNKIKEILAIYSPNKTTSFKNFESINQTNEYVKDPGYGVAIDKPELCFGFYFQKVDETNYNYSLHYFDSNIRGAIQDTPSTLKKSLDPFQSGQDMSSYGRWLSSGYLQMVKIINEVILQKVTNNSKAQINLGVISQKYSAYKQDPFSNFIGFILPFFLVIAYVSPLCILVFRMVQDKETRVKEGMKIMGLNESIYFLSYFLQWLVLNSIYAIINSLILTRVLTNIGFLYILGFFWLYGMCIFALAYFFQALMDKTRIAIIITILVYFIMYFVSVAVLSEDVENIAKMFLSLLPPTALQLGLSVLAQFEGSFKAFSGANVTFSFNNYSVSDMYLMFFIDFIVYLFLGYYLQNVLSHQFGIKRPFYFLCSKSFWCKKSNKISNFNNLPISSDYTKIDIGAHRQVDSENFQSEQAYVEKLRSGDCLQIKDLRKEFDDGKVAVDGLNLNLYKEEIFALLGHNGAGKSTTISILCGLYEATSGTAIYKGENILEDENMEAFRRKLGICPQHDVLFNDLTVREHLNMFCVFKGVQSSLIDGEIEKILHDVHMVDKADELSKNLSGGQKRKLSIAIALIGGSEIVFLDEPSSGMDITSRRNLWEILKKCTGNRIIVLTTHYMEEAAVLGNRIGIVSNGKLKCCGNGLFLINNFGKYISLNVYKNPDARDDEIIQFIKNRVPQVEYEILSEEILFRIPKISSSMSNSNVGNFSFKTFFKDLDANVERLRVKSYGASMPTLEDVFLNVSADSKQKLLVSQEKEEAFGIDENLLKNAGKNQISCCSKFMIDLKVSLKKRMLQILRDAKTFVLEILCPILLVLIGLGVSSVQFIKDSPSVNVSLLELPTGQKMIINSNFYDNTINNYAFQSPDVTYNATFEYVTVQNANTTISTLFNYLGQIRDKNITDSYGSYYISTWDNAKNLYEFIVCANTQSRNAPIIYAQYMMDQILSSATGKKIQVTYNHMPFPLTSKARNQGETRNNSNLVFFVSVAFALIPANFVTLIIKERETNTKHLQVISGISLTAYWTSNYIFELVKYYFIGGINLLLILAFDNFPYYLWLLYLLYGFSMVSFTYMLSLLFKFESTGQNVVILINFLFGALGGSVILILRILDDLINIGKGIAYILRIVPSFAFSYGFNQLLSAQLLFVVDYPTSFVPMLLDINGNIIKAEYVGSDIIYMVVESFFYLLILIIFESSRNCCHRRNAYSKLEDVEMQLINDSIVKKEIEKANTVIEETDNSKYSIRVRNLEKVYSNRCCSPGFKAVNKLSFCLEFGECFALLGVNGAGKTTTFKALTCEDLASGGDIFINGLDISSNFNKVRNLIGYCPQFDAIFEYMTVYENLEFYAKLKGIPSENVDQVIDSLMREMNLAQYRNKISGNLSGGNKRKLSVTIAMIGNPPIVLLDEPSTGMDPEARRFMWAVIHKISTRSKNSSVILTTHSMEEAETLCRRMGIMVAGQFKCLGTGQYIKDKYGTGYEIDLRIMNMPDATLNEILTSNKLNPNEEITAANKIEELLNKMGKHNYLLQIAEHKLGTELFEEIRDNGKITVRKLIEWIFYTENFMKCVNKILDHFDDVSVAEFWDNNYKLKIRKNQNVNSIGFLFGLFEDQKSECFLAEYSISQTSLEQIFNKFASETDKEILLENTKKELKINRELVRDLIDTNLKLK